MAGMLRLWPSGDGGSAPLSDDELAAMYAYPEPLDRPWLRVNFVASADGAGSSGGRSGGLGSPPDHRVFHLLRELSQVIVVGAETVRVENYGGARTSRFTGAAPRIAVVSGSAALDPRARLFNRTAVPPLVITTNRASAERRDRLAEAGAEVVALDADRVPPDGLLAALAERGLYRVLCEGGATLFGQLIEGGAVDELCLTVAPLLTAGPAARIAWGPSERPNRLNLAGVLLEDDVLLLRYRRGSPAESAGAPPTG
jgi:5-amino-6-(5-phosphoribosylamino)uracil reductase